MTEEVVAAIDQGTTGTRCILFDDAGRIVASDYRRHEQRYPNPGWVEHDPAEIWTSTKTVVRGALEEANREAAAIAAIGITNQRETTVLWDEATGEPLHDAIVWQDRRTTDRIDALEAAGKSEWIRERTGLEPDAYFSATKLEWLLDELGSDVRARARAGDLCFGTIDAWLRYKLTGVHATDVTNAARTMLFDIEDLAWDEELLAEFGVPRALLPTVRPSIEAPPFDRTDPDGFLDAAVPLTASFGDQQASLFGHACFEPGEAKNTYGTGSFFLLNTGTTAVSSEHGLLTTVACQRAGEPATYALEGSIFVTGAAIEWLEDVRLIDDPAETATLARQVEDTDDVFVVPAFSGLGAPHWDGRARGTIVGMTRSTRREHIVRATLEAIAYRTRDVAAAMAADSGIDITDLRVDGGSVKNDVLCQLQADLVETDIVRPTVDEITAFGAACGAGLAVDVFDDLEDVRDALTVDRRFEPSMDETTVADRYERWGEAVERSRGWAREGS